MRPIENIQNTVLNNIDAAIITSKYNRRYLTGFESSDGILFLTKDKAIYLVDFRYIEAARANITDCEVTLLE
jgi:Xaa-Pro aminopeptidase